jgi:glycerol-3-phosphate acyltransferase PlsY
MTVPQIAEIVLCVAFAVIGYLIGSLTLALMLRKLAGPRAGHKGVAFAALALDGSKAGAACLIGWSTTQYLIQNHVPLGFRVDLWNTPLVVGLVAGAFAVIGHCFPVWLRFRGGSAVVPAAGLAIVATALLVAAGV